MTYTIIERQDQDARVKLGRTTYRAYSGKKLQELYPDGNCTIVGEVKNGSSKHQVGALNIGHPLSQRGAHSPLFTREAGYLCVGEKAYVAVLRPNALLRWLLVLALLVIASTVLLQLGIFTPGGSDTRPDAQGDVQIGDRMDYIEDAPEPVEPEEKLEDTIAFTGYGKAIVSEKNPYIELSNPAKNFVDFVFTVTDKATGEVIAVTDSVAPGKNAYVNVMDHFRGTQGGIVTIHTATFTEDNTPASGMNSEVEIEINN